MRALNPQKALSNDVLGSQGQSFSFRQGPPAPHPQRPAERAPGLALVTELLPLGGLVGGRAAAHRAPGALALAAQGAWRTEGNQNRWWRNPARTTQKPSECWTPPRKYQDTMVSTSSSIHSMLPLLGGFTHRSGPLKVSFRIFQRERCPRNAATSQVVELAKCAWCHTHTHAQHFRNCLFGSSCFC